MVATMRCPSCNVIIDLRAAWKNSTEHFYCSEFCADCEVSALAQACTKKVAIDQQHLDRPRRLSPVIHFKSTGPRSASAL
jgi:hypothetical protein